MNPGDIYKINYDPLPGSTHNKIMSVVILSGGDHLYLPMAIIAPVIDWEDYLNENPFFVSLETEYRKELHNKLMIDCYQIRAIEHERFIEKIGTLPTNKMNQIKKSISLILDIEPEHCE